jgi:hypothetical protein
MIAVAPRDYRLAPRIGNWEIALIRLARSLKDPNSSAAHDVERRVDEVLAQLALHEEPRPSRDRLKYAYTLSVMLDILHVGGRVQVVDSQIYITWPNWDDPIDGRELTRRALAAVADPRPASSEERARLSAVFAPSVTPQSIQNVLREGKFWLERVEGTHPSGVPYSEAFTLALRTWTMPYRGRQGRSRRFVVLGQHPELGNDPVVVGLIELGDDGPYNSLRDEFLGLRPGALLAWLRSTANAPEVARRIACHFRELRSALRSIPNVAIDSDPAELIEGELSLLKIAHGRSRIDDLDDFRPKKGIAYLLRLAHGEAAFNRLASGQELDATDRSLREGVRAFHNLILPRVSMEVTVCGSVPPFSAGLGGKLVASFLGHPWILNAVRQSRSTVLEQVFNTDRVVPLLPHAGALALITKGLYPGHSALYNRAEVPGSHGPQRLQKLGETRGSTTSLLGARTARLARVLVESGDGERNVSLTYGTGGAKRQRTIEAAILECGLPETLVHAGIRRPVYGLSTASNTPAVVWAGESPRWLVDPTADPLAYSENAVALWRRRWLRQVERRLAAVTGSLEGTIESLDQGGEGAQDG